MYEVSLTESYFPAQTDTEYRERTIEGMLREQAEKRGESLALRELHADGSIGREWTYSQMLDLAERCGRALASRHPKDSRIAIMAGNCPEWVVLQMGAALAGLTLVTVNPAYTARELRYVLEQSNSIAIYYQPHVRGNALRPIIDEAAKGLPASDQAIDIERHGDLFAGEHDGDLSETGPHDIVMIQYTSGTTGFPKGVLLHQHGLVQSNHDLMKRWNVNAGDTLMCLVPLFHTAGSAASVLGAFSRGAKLLLVTQFDPAMMVAAIVEHQPDTVGGVPTMIFGMIEAARAGGHTITGIKSVFSGGAMVAPELNRSAKEVFGVPIVIVYGQTETSPAITATWPKDNDHDLTQTIGQPCPHMEVSIRNPSGNSVCAVGEQGEICMRGYNMMAGYNDNPKATAETVDADGWLHTGDLGTMDERGYVRITGRVKEMIIRGGENLFPAEIEAALLEHPAIAEVAVAGVPDKKWGEIVAAFLRLADGSERPSEAELRTFIRQRLSPQKTPAHWVWVSEFPLTGSGKIKKFDMAEAFANGEFS